MTVTTRHNRNERLRTAEDGAKIIELGSIPDEVTIVEATNNEEREMYVRHWPTQESAQAWCDYMLAKGPEICNSAVILED